MGTSKQREIWIDNVKVIACILVVMGHFFQSMTKANVLPAKDLYQWFNQTIYYFHVPLFFICSGYLYQKMSKVDNAFNWSRNILKKALNLGIPYFTFTLATWILKTVFSSATNDKIGGLFETLFLHPTSPYWYLYALFFIFLVTPTFGSRKIACVGLVVSVILKALKIIVAGYGIQAISYVLSNEIWFAIGMCLSVFEFSKNVGKVKLIVSIAAGIGFIGLSMLIYKLGIQNEGVEFAMGLLACFSIILFVEAIYKEGKQSPIFGVFARYTMPIFLMHTLFAAPLRVLLFKVNIQNAVIHVVLGILVSFAGPIVAAVIMAKSKWLEFFLYPGKVLKANKWKTK